MTLERFLILSAVLFAIGLYGVLTKRNAITILMSLEVMFNAVNVAAVAMSRYIAPAALRADPSATGDSVVQMLLTGQVFAMFVIAVAAAEVALGLAIVIAIYRNSGSIFVTDAAQMRN